MATSFFHEETLPTDDDTVMELVRYYYDDISAEVLTRSFHLFPATGAREFLENGRIPFADLRADLKVRLTRFLYHRHDKSEPVS
jgi:hypothetical protein